MKLTLGILSIFLTLFASISYGQSFSFNYNLIRVWDENSKYDQEPPYVYSKKRNNKELKYISVVHTRSLNDSTAKLIKETIETFKPDIVIVEGVPTSYGFDIEIQKQAIDCIKNIEISGRPCGERDYTLKVAADNKIPFIGGEPGQEDERVYLTDYNEEEILFYYVARNLNQMIEAKLSNINSVREKNDSQRIFETIEDDYKKMLSQQLRSNDVNKPEYDFDKFKKWYSKSSGKGEFDPFKSQSSDYAPKNSGTELTELNKMSFQIDKAREPNILKTIQTQLNTYSKVLVVYGSAHLYKHKLVLEDAFSDKSQKKVNVDDSGRGFSKDVDNSSPLVPMNNSASKTIEH
jgi:hypothetical protein